MEISFVKIFYGEDRKAISKKVKATLKDYEIIDGENILAQDLVNIFLGTTLFSDSRNILIRDLGPEKLAQINQKLLNTPHKIIIWETKLDKRKKAIKELLKHLPATEFKRTQTAEEKLVFEIFDIALKDSNRAIQMTAQIENYQDPFMFFGLIVKKTLDKYELTKDKKLETAIKDLAKIDLIMKSSSTISPWTLVKSALLSLQLH